MRICRKLHYRFTFRLLQEKGVLDGGQAEGLPAAEMLSEGKMVERGRNGFVPLLVFQGRWKIE